MSLAEAQTFLGYAQELIHQDKLQFHNPCIVRLGDGYNVVYEDVEKEPWNQTGKPKIDRVSNAFCGTTRPSEHGTTLYIGSCRGEYGTLERFLNKSFRYIEGWNDGPYRSVWLSEELLAGITYCEGDVSIDIANDAEGYKRIVEAAMQFYTINNDHWVEIPDSMKITQAIVDAMPQEWKQIKLRANGTDIIARGFSSDVLWDVAQKWFEGNPDGLLKLDAGGRALYFGKVPSEQPGDRAEFDRCFPGLENKE